MRRALHSLYLEVPSTIANHVQDKVHAYVNELLLVIAELRAVCGPKLECCGRFAVEHSERWVIDGSGREPNGFRLKCPGKRDRIALPPEYLEWRESRRQG
jgi:hypothetical protein